MGKHQTEIAIPFALHCDHNPRRSVLIDFFVDLGVEADGAHDSVTELLVHDSLVGVAVVLHDLVEPVDEWLDRRHGSRPAPVGEA